MKGTDKDADFLRWATINRAVIYSLLIAAMLFAGCSIRRSIYKRFELPKGLDEATEQRVFLGVVQAMRSQPFVDELKKRFPLVTQAQLLKTDIRWDVVKISAWELPSRSTTQSRAFFISFGVKDTSDFPEAPALVDFFLDYGKVEAEKLLASTTAKKA